MDYLEYNAPNSTNGLQPSLLQLLIDVYSLEGLQQMIGQNILSNILSNFRLNR